MRLSTRLTILAALLFPLAACRYPKTTPSVDEPHPQTTPATHADVEEAAVPLPKSPAINREIVATAAADDRPILVCFGDSLTAGQGAARGQSYPDYLQADLDQRDLRYRVVNLGVSGETTKDGVARLPEVLALHPAVVVVEFGGNDGLRGLPVSESRANLDHIVSTVKASGAKVALAGITLPPTTAPTISTSSTRPTSCSPANTASPCCPSCSRTSTASPA